MTIYQSMMLPNRLFVIRIDHTDRYTRVLFDRMLEPFIVTPEHPIELTFQTIEPHPTRVEAARVYDNL